MLKEDNKERIIAICYSLLVFFMISEPFVFQITNKEQIRMYGYLLFLIGVIVLATIFRKGGEKQK